MCVQIDGNIIERVEVTKFLGVHVDQELNWKFHTSQVELKIVKSLGILNKVKNILNKEVLRILYFTMIQPYLTYCNIVWGEASQLALNGLKCLQKRAVRLITHSQYRAPSSPIFKDICVLKIEDLHSLQLALFVYKVQNNLVPQSCLRHISFAVNPHQYLRQVTYVGRMSFVLLPFVQMFVKNILECVVQNIGTLYQNLLRSQFIRLMLSNED